MKLVSAASVSQSEGLRAAMQNMRAVKAALARGENIKDIPVVYSAPDPSLIQCEMLRLLKFF